MRTTDSSTPRACAKDPKDTAATVSVQRYDRATGQHLWCRAKRKRTERYQDSIAVACGGFIILPGGIEMGREVTCPDCKAGRDWTAEAGS